MLTFEYDYMKHFIRILYYRSALIRLIIGFISVISHRTSFLRVFHFLSYEEENAIGPLQRDEAVAIFGITRVVRPNTIVEFGFFHGHSAYNFLAALEPNALLFSYDIDSVSEFRAKTEFSHFRNFKFIGKSQTDFCASDIDNRPVDLVFFDASHCLDLNKTTFLKVYPHLAENGLIIIHDTGVWNNKYFSDTHRHFVEELDPPRTPDGFYIHQPDEREFVRWVLTEYNVLTEFHLHTTNTLRHGFTRIQRRNTEMCSNKPIEPIR